MALLGGYSFGPVTPQMFAQQMPDQAPGLMPYSQMPQMPQLPMAMAPALPNTQSQSAPPVSLNDIMNQSNAAQQPNQNDFVQKILSTRFQPDMGDVGTAALRTAQSYAQTLGGRTVTPQDIAGQRVQSELAPYSTMLDFGIRERQAMPDFTKMAQMAFMKQASGQPMTLQDQAAVNAWRNMGQNGIMFDPNTGSMIQTNTRMPGGMAQPSMNQNMMPSNGNVQSNVPPPPMSPEQVINNASGNQLSQVPMPMPNMPQFATPKAQAAYNNKLAEGGAEKQLADTETARSTQDVVGLYNKIKTDATNAPSGVVENLYANATNAAGMPSAGAIAKGTYDADLNNLYLAMIRSLKGTGRVMQSELQAIQEAQPKATDSLQVKQAKADAHMAYYQNKMREVGYDPNSGLPMGNNQIAPQQPMQSQDNNSSNGWSIQRIN